MKALRRLGALLLLAGACLSARAVYLHAKAQLAEVLIRRAWEMSVQSGKVQPPWSWADTYPIARMRIPRLGFDEMVLEDASPRNLAFGPARLLSGAEFGKPGNVIIAGHRTTWFRSLEAVTKDDAIEVEWFEPGSSGVRRRSYTVQDIRVTDPDDVSLLQPSSEDLLTLITCYPFGPRPGSPERFVVRAR
ncbi:MAG TPA: class GN sortase [Terriglobales bacterium]|jgi:sortase A